MFQTLLAFTAIVSAGPALPREDASSALSPRNLENHLRVLTSPEFGGRMTLAPGLNMTADYIAREFKRLGLEARDPGYIHQFDVSINSRPTANNLLVVIGADGKRTSLNVGQDFVPMVGSTPMKLVTAPLAYVGYGIVEDGWNDYEGIDVTGRIVVAFRGVPEGRTNRQNAVKARWAHERGAAGILFVGPSGPGRQELPPFNRQLGLPTLAGFVGAAVHSSQFKALTGLDFAAARAATKPSSKLLDTQVRLVTETEPNRGMCKNVIGYLPGNDPKLKNEYIIIGGHMDHLGFGEVGSRTGNDALHPGADDNGTGTVGVLALAEYFARTRSNRRTIIFQTYSAEEIGLIGSRKWADDPKHADILKNTSVMINMDMVGRPRDRQLFVFGTSSAAEIGDILQGIKPQDLVLRITPNVRADSDHFSFARKQVPVAFFHTGLHNDYHTENDKLETIDFDGMSRVMDAVRQTVEAIDAREEILRWNTNAEMGNRPNDIRPPSGEQAGRRVRLGFIPNMQGAGPGMLIEGVTQGTPAEKAGFKAGDRILEINGRKLNGVEDLQTVMTSLRVGDKIKVVFERDGKRMEVEMTAEARPAG